jgi:hypothetical protein
MNSSTRSIAQIATTTFILCCFASAVKAAPVVEDVMGVKWGASPQEVSQIMLAKPGVQALTAPSSGFIMGKG